MSSKQVHFNVLNTPLREKRDKLRHRYSNSTIQNYINTCSDTIENQLNQMEQNSKLHSQLSLSIRNKRINDIRKDAYGNTIKKGRKDYKVSFIDNFGPRPIADVINVDLNQEITVKFERVAKFETFPQKNNDNADTNCTCSSAVCVIF